MAKRRLLPAAPSMSRAVGATGDSSRRVLASLKGTKDLADVQLGSEALDSDITEWVNTQVATLNYAIQRPGIPVGRVTVLIGKEGGGKSTLVYHLLAQAQVQGGLAVLVDSERRFDRQRGARIGIRLDDLVIINGRTVEKVFRTIEKIVKDEPDTLMLIAIDSLAGLPSQAALDKELGEASVAMVARIVSQACSRLSPDLARSRCALVIVNQLRSYIDTSNAPRGRERRKLMHDRAMVAEGPLSYYASLGIYLTSTGFLGERDAPDGISVRAEIRKSSVGGSGEGRRAEFDITYQTGIDTAGNKLDLLVELGTAKQSGPWYNIEGVEAKFMRKTWPAVLAEHPELEEIIRMAPEAWMPADQKTKG